MRVAMRSLVALLLISMALVLSPAASAGPRNGDTAAGAVLHEVLPKSLDRFESLIARLIGRAIQVLSDDMTGPRP